MFDGADTDEINEMTIAHIYSEVSNFLLKFPAAKTAEKVYALLHSVAAEIDCKDANTVRFAKEALQEVINMDIENRAAIGKQTVNRIFGH